MTIDDLTVHNAIVKDGFHYWERETPGYTAPIDGMIISIIEKYDATDTWKTLDIYGGEGPQGWSGESYMIFRASVGTEEKFYKKIGSSDSYGETAWDGGFYRVEAKKVTVEVWDFA